MPSPTPVAPAGRALLAATAAAAARAPAGVLPGALMIWICGPERRYTFLNPAALSFTGLDLQHGVADWAGLIDRSSRRRFLARCGSALTARRPFRMEYRMRGADGNYHWILNEGVPFALADGPGGLFCWCADVTHLRDAAPAAPRDSGLRELVDAVPVHLTVCDADGVIRFVNRAQAEALGLRPAQPAGRHLRDVLGSVAFQQIAPALAGEPVERDITLRGGPRRRYMHLSCVPTHGADGRVTGVVIAQTDITQRRRAERALHQRERGFRTLAENLPDCVARVDRELALLYVNQAMLAAFGLDPVELPGRTPAGSGLPAAAAVACESAARTALDSGREQHFSFQLGAAVDSQHFNGRAIPEFDRAGAPETVLLIIYDVTKRALAEREREALLSREQAARSQAEAATQARDQFLAIVSHELRSPLNGIQSWAHVLEQQVAEPTPLFQRALAGIRTGVAQQVRLIEDLLDATRIVSGQLRLTRHPCKLRPVVDAALDSVRPSARAKDIELVTSVALDGEQTYGDPDRLQQIFWNLFDNAIKFSPAGGKVWVTVAADAAGALITVRDEGKGITPDFLPFLFERFRQADASTTRRHQGLGLGLALVRHLTEMHGGQIRAESAGANQGATFTLRLPLRQFFPAQPEERRLFEEGGTPLPSLAGYHVLVVDDQDEAREAVCALLDHAGAVVTAASSCREALRRLDGLAPGLAPNVLLCDIAMPDEDGYATLRKIREWEARRRVPRVRQMPAIALTAHSHDDDRIRALASGYRMHLTKPISPAELIMVVAAAGNARTPKKDARS